VVRAGASRSDELVADAAGEREVGEAVAVQVTELAAAEPELGAPEAVRLCRYPWPGKHLAADFLGDTHTFSNGPPGRLLPGLLSTRRRRFSGHPPVVEE
jgi:hypothetical protein